MKKLVPLICILLTLCGCSARNITPTTNTTVDLSAVYRVGDFYYDCDIVWENGVLTVTPTTTLAAGMVMSCDGKMVTFNRNDMIKSLPVAKVSAYNPSVVLYEVISSLSILHSEKVNDGYSYNGTTSVGEFVLLQSKDNNYISLSIPQADIEVEFKN